MNSPLDADMKKLFNYEPEVYAQKQFKANWYIRDSELVLLFANGLSWRNVALKRSYL
jgi:hypothetical protein